MQQNLDDVYKDVVVIGNGPSGICLSYMLAGNWPYYNGNPHPGDEMLTARLKYSVGTQTPSRLDYNELKENEFDNRKQGKNLVENNQENLESLSLGLDGRGSRPLARLMDQLQHPCTDAGMDFPSLLTWKSPEQCPDHKIVDHVVLGKGPPGGAWHSLDPNILTISLSRWMSLPGLDLRHWEMLITAEKQRTNLNRNSMQEKIGACKPAKRVSIGTVAAYYRDYVTRQGLEKYFRCGTTITSVRENFDEKDNKRGYVWLVHGYENISRRTFSYKCRKVILATGTIDSLNRLGIPGEKAHNDWVTHDLNVLESRLNQMVNSQDSCSIMGEFKTKSKKTVDPILVVGAGLSAADAIMAARFRGIPVLHAFRDSSKDWNNEKQTFDRLKWLPVSIYPEYHKVYEMMADGGTNYPLYKALPGFTLMDVNETSKDDDNQSKEKRVTLCTPDGQLISYQVSHAAILIGARPDLSYLENNGFGLGKFRDLSIDSKWNPIEINDFTYEVIQAPRNGLYALGPLVGDNFVRFILGGAFAILVHIHSSSCK
ncbi:oxidative stress-induced growth inhibitor 1-like [Leptopilina boulardi]|uniref:oxidative stress-induced growth inhibitor 1-like n=1 Tax=Leptopilina boulardi TaxID=63433 RepID=UPI0021F62E53|nr:oxidative stress-induced growth inhibitor 1-like [Leptopilina boulardi]